MLILLLACSTSQKGWQCLLSEDVDYAQRLGCQGDFDTLAANPYDASIPGAWSVKTVIDRLNADALYFQNVNRYPLHWDFASVFLSGDGLPYVPDQSTFNLTEYYSPDRRFLLGAVTWYEEPDVWVYEISPYDTADATMITDAFRWIRQSAWFGPQLQFHPTSAAIEGVAATLPADIPVITTEELYAGISYQPLNLGTTMGQLRFYEADSLDDAYVNYREVVVLDEIPLDLSVVAGTITAAFQTPLSHINVLAQNRGTPNMAWRPAWDDTALRALEGLWVELTVAPFEWTIREVTQSEADTWWEENKPDPLTVTPMDTSVTALTDAEDILDLDNLSLGAALDQAIPAFGGKASHFGGLVHIGEPVQTPDAFAVPVYWYDQHMQSNGLWDVAAAMMADPAFVSDAATRASMLEDFKDQIIAAPLDASFAALLNEKLAADYPGQRMRFRSSTTAEDLGSFTGAGLYDSESATPGDDSDPVDVAVKTVWASVWDPRAYEERAYWSIDHLQVGMALLVHPSFSEEEANGVAITNNIFDTSGTEPAFYINAQVGEASVVEPDEGVTSDQILYYYYYPSQPTVYLGHSSLVADGATVLSASELYDLGQALDAIHMYFAEVYGSGSFYAMDTEFKLERYSDGTYDVVIKQARPYPGWGE